jgi:hypothetical protein
MNNFISYVECLSRLGQFDEALRVLSEESPKDAADQWPNATIIRKLSNFLRQNRPKELARLTDWVKQHKPELSSALESRSTNV